MPYNSESRIRFHVVLILAIVTMVCLGAMIYFYTFRVNIDQQKEAVQRETPGGEVIPWK